MTIQGKVAAILNERELVINRGGEAGIKAGMKFKVIEPEFTLTDPDTDERLGSITKEKIRVKIFEVQDKFSVGRTYENYVVNIGGRGGTFTSDLLSRDLKTSPRHEVTRVRTLRADDSTRFEPIDDESSFVKVGDTVVQVENEL